MFVMDMPPDVPPQYAPIVVVQAAQAQAENTSDKRTIGVCHLATSNEVGIRSAINSVSPIGTAWGYLRNIEKRLVELAGTATILTEPAHGKLEALGATGAYVYVPEPNYVGQDKATFLVKIGGYEVKLLFFFNVSLGSWGGTDGYDPYEDKQFCPKGGWWRISSTPSTPSSIPSN